MPTKYIRPCVWDDIQSMTVAAVTELQIPINDTTVLRCALEKGLATVTAENIRAEFGKGDE